MMPELDALLTVLRTAAEPTRIRLLALCADSELTVTELTQILGQSQPRVSRHLKLMVDAGLLERFREGTWAFYRLARPGAPTEIARKVLELPGPRRRPAISAITRSNGMKSGGSMSTMGRWNPRS
jgi:ArsR family transcriptional regulator